MSWIGFFIPVEIVPGRMALLVTIFLMLINTANTSRENNPSAEGPTALVGIGDISRLETKPAILCLIVSR